MTFDKLADRCLLFIDERKQMLIELLKEAELEISRKCNMYEDERVFSVYGEESYGLPENYKQISFIQFDGDRLKPISEDEVNYASSGDIPGGTPTGYFIRNNSIYFNYKPVTGTVKMAYYGTVENIQDESSAPSPIIPTAYHRDLCDYAIAIAAAKNLPDIYARHWMMWQNNINEIINEDANRELIHSIKREV